MAAPAFKPQIVTTESIAPPAKPAGDMFHRRCVGASRAEAEEPPRRRRRQDEIRSRQCVPPLVVLAAILLVWQIAFGRPGASLPPPTTIWTEAKDLIIDPFFVHGSQDIGLGWRVLTSLERVLYGFGLAAVVGVLLGALVGQSVWATRGLDPIFQVLRTVPPLAWLPISLAAFRDANPSAIFVIFITAIWPVIINTAVGIRNIPQDYRNVAQVLRLNTIEFFFKIMVPSAAPTSSRASGSASASPGSRLSRRRC